MFLIMESPIITISDPISWVTFSLCSDADLFTSSSNSWSLTLRTSNWFFDSYDVVASGVMDTLPLRFFLLSRIPAFLCCSYQGLLLAFLRQLLNSCSQIPSLQFSFFLVIILIFAELASGQL